MSNLKLICLDFSDLFVLTQIKSHLSEIIPTKIIYKKINNNLSDYFHKERQQYNAGRIIEAYTSGKKINKSIILTSVDLYIPIFTFVFGLAKLNGEVGIVSAHRLSNEFYGLPGNEKLFRTRLLKEIIHELGHLYNLRHCNNYICVMASSTTVDDLDIKHTEFCALCRKTFIENC